MWGLTLTLPHSLTHTHTLSLPHAHIMQLFFFFCKFLLPHPQQYCRLAVSSLALCRLVRTVHAEVIRHPAASVLRTNPKINNMHHVEAPRGRRNELQINVCHLDLMTVTADWLITVTVKVSPPFIADNVVILLSH